MNKEGQLKLSFGMIFSIFLIIVFIFFAIYAIQNFLGFQEDVKVKQFYDNLQNDVDKAWKSTKASKIVEYNLPEDVERVCFSNDEFQNVLLYGDLTSAEKIEHLSVESNFCVDNLVGKTSFTLEKEYGESLVKVKA